MRRLVYILGATAIVAAVAFFFGVTVEDKADGYELAYRR